MALDLHHQTPAEFAARFRAAYLAAAGAEVGRLARWLLARITAGDLTDAQVRSVFGLTAAQWTNVKARMQTAADAYVAARDARGE